MAKKHLEQYDQNGVQQEIYLNDDEVMVGDKTLADKLDEMQDDIEDAGSGDGTVTGVKVGDTPYSPDSNGVVDLSTPFADKVDKETGKGLSSNDYTTAEKTKLAGIAEGAQVNVINSITVNGTPQTPTNGNVNIVVSGGGGSGETIPFDAGGTAIIDSASSPNADTVLAAASARWVKEIDTNVKAILAALANLAFTTAKPTWQTVAKRTYTLSYGTLTGCTANVQDGTVEEGYLKIIFTPTSSSYAFTSILVNGESVTPTSTGESDGSVYIEISVGNNITVSATAVSGRSIDFSGSTGCTIDAASIPMNTDLSTTIRASSHYELPNSITVKVGSTAITHTYTKAQDGKTATLFVDKQYITGDLTIVCTATAYSKILTVTLVGTNVVFKHDNDVLTGSVDVYADDIPYAISIKPEGTNVITTAPTATGGGTVDSDGAGGYTLTIGSSDTSNITLQASAGEPASVSVTKNLTGVEVDSETANVVYNQLYELTIKRHKYYYPLGTYPNDETLTVTMGGTDITSSAWNASTGKISIAHVTGVVVITVAAVSYIDWNKGYDDAELVSTSSSDGGSTGNANNINHVCAVLAYIKIPEGTSQAIFNSGGSVQENHECLVLYNDSGWMTDSGGRSCYIFKGSSRTVTNFLGQNGTAKYARISFHHTNGTIASGAFLKFTVNGVDKTVFDPANGIYNTEFVKELPGNA